MLKKLPLATIAALGISFFGISPALFAEGDHAHVHAKPDHENHGSAHWTSPKDAAAKINPIKSDKDSIARGAKSYATLCVSCHGKEGLGDGVIAPSLNPKPTNLKAMSGGHSDGDFAWKVANGRGAMPAWKNTLSENEIWDLVNFIQNLKNENSNDENNMSNDYYNKHKHKH